MSPRSEATTRVELTHDELVLIKSFIENIDQGAWIDRLTDKLERAIARIGGHRIPAQRKVVALDSPADERRALCRACGWNGTVTKTRPCPTCGQKVNPLIYDGRTKP